MRAQFEQVDSHEALLKALVRVRVGLGEQANGLSVAPGDRRRWIEGLVEADFFSLQRDLDVFEHLASRAGARVQTASLAVASMVASSERGAAYLVSRPEAVARILEVVQRVPERSVAQRFGLALLQKLSYERGTAAALLDLKAESFTAGFLASSRPGACTGPTTPTTTCSS